MLKRLVHGPMIVVRWCAVVVGVLGWLLVVPLLEIGRSVGRAIARTLPRSARRAALPEPATNDSGVDELDDRRAASRTRSA
jgi:hypothetical protein